MRIQDSHTYIADLDVAIEHSIGLKNLEKQFGIIRESEVISGSNLAKTFHKVMKDKDYIKRMPREKIEKIHLPAGSDGACHDVALAAERSCGHWRTVSCRRILRRTVWNRGAAAVRGGICVPDRAL